MTDPGVYAWSELARRAARAELQRMIADGDLICIRRGWYRSAQADPLVVEAVQRGGVLSCVSALRRHGIWVPGSPQEVHTRGNASGHRRPGHCRQYGRPEPTLTAVDPLAIAYRHAVRCLDPEGIVVISDSILNSTPSTLTDLAAELANAPRAIRDLLDRCDGRSQAGTESMARLRIRSMGLQVRVQVVIPGVGRVDLLICDRLIVEIDSHRFHRTPEQFEADRRRDRAAARLGYLTIRPTYLAVTADWAEVEAEVRDITRAGGHLWPRHR